MILPWQGGRAGTEQWLTGAKKLYRQAGEGKGANGGKWRERKVNWEQPRGALLTSTAIAPV